MDAVGIVTRGDLPHWYMPGYAHFVTYRLFNSIPKLHLAEMTGRRKARVDSPERFKIPSHRSREVAHKLFFSEYDQFLDRQPVSRCLEIPAVANMVRENLYHHNGSLYDLLAWCVMPNHVHILIQPFEGSLDLNFLDAVNSKPNRDSIVSDESDDNRSPLSRIMHSLKSYTANQANVILSRSGTFWQRESYDHWVRDLDELQRVVEYIASNPVKAGLCEKPRDWVYSSAFDRFQLDGSDCAMVGQLRDDWQR